MTRKRECVTTHARNAALWCALYAAVHLGWAATGTAVPWTATVPYPPAALLLLAALAVLAAGACLASPGKLPGRVAVGAALAVTIAVFAVGMISLPLHLVTLLSGAGVESPTGLVQVLLTAVAAGLLTLVATGSLRRLRGRCPRCGLAHREAAGGRTHPPASTATPRTQVAAYLLICGLIPWSAVKTVWTLGGSALGVTAEEWAAANADAPGAAHALASVGVDVTVLAALFGVFLLAGLMYRWGMVFPRWTLWLSGVRVPRLLPLIPAWMTAVALSLYGVALTVYVPAGVLGVVPAIEPIAGFTATGSVWMIEFGGLAFAGLGLGLLVAARSYARRTRPRCVVR
ncbi:hypothetical protein AB0J63_30110 [Streptosporangium canum]|uniref:hypothetical protein n=1 Tax=Streptosporangium canum TaxID=324952 RepID=UPI003417631B